MRAVHALLLAALILVGAMGGPALARAQPYSVWDAGELGLGHLVVARGGALAFAGHDMVVAEGRLHAVVGWALLVAEPQRGFSDHEVQQLRRFLEEGGQALFAGASPVVAELLLQLNAGITLGGEVYTPGYRSDAAFPIAEGLGGSWVLTTPRAVHGGQPMLSTGLAWEDLDLDGQPDLGEPIAPMTLAASAQVGKGLLLVVGSASPLTRDGWALGPGPALLATLMGGQRGVVVDEAHRLVLDPLGLAGLIAGEPQGFVLPALALCLGAVWALRPQFHRKHEEPSPRGDARMVVEAAREVPR